MPDAPAWMPSPEATDNGVRRTRGEEMERRIVEAARITFRRLSYEAARVDDIVEQAGVAHGAFYRYFRNKEDLLHRLAVECASRVQALTADLEAMPRPIQAGDLARWVGQFGAVYREDGPVIRVWMDNRDSDPLMQALASDSLGPLAAALASLVEPATAAAVGAETAGLGMLALLERLNSYFAAANHDAVAATASRLLFAATVHPDP